MSAAVQAAVAAHPIITPEQWTPAITQGKVPQPFYSIQVPALGACEYQGAAQPYALTVPSPGTIRFELHEGDQHFFDIEAKTGSERCELATRITAVNVGQPAAFHFAFSIDPGPLSTASWLVLMQLHQNLEATATPPPPPIALCLETGDYLSVWARHDQSGKLVEKIVWKDTKPIVRGQRYVIDMAFLLDPDGGRLVVKRDGVTIVNDRDPLGYREMQSVYISPGIYRHGPTPEPMAARFGAFSLTVMDGEIV